MMSILKSCFTAIRRAFRSRTDLLLEVAALRQQIEVHQRQTPRPRLQRSDRLFWIWLCRHWPKWRSALVIVKPKTVLKWHREGYRRHWRRRSKGRLGRPRIPRKHIEFIRRISLDNPGYVKLENMWSSVGFVVACTCSCTTGSLPSSASATAFISLETGGAHGTGSVEAPWNILFTHPQGLDCSGVCRLPLSFRHSPVRTHHHWSGKLGNIRRSGGRARAHRDVSRERRGQLPGRGSVGSSLRFHEGRSGSHRISLSSTSSRPTGRQRPFLCR